MKRLLILGVFVLTAVGQDVEHAPTVAQCQADQRLWDSKLSAPAEDWAHSANDISSKTLNIWLKEMNACVVVDPNTRHEYVGTENYIQLVRGDRQGDFLRRHNLTDKFYEEDAAGER